MDARKTRILEFVKSKGPIIASELSKAIGVDTLMASAMLSELVSAKQVKVSHMKIGSGPLYYLNGQEYKLQNFSDKLNEKERGVFVLLKEKKILRDSELNPLSRVAVRQIRDFARPLEVNHKGSKEIFWKWYLLDNKDAERMILSKLKVKKEEPKKIEQPKKVKKTEQRKEVQKKIEPIEKKEVKKAVKDDFLEDVKKYFKKNEIEVLDQNVIRKTEIEFLVEIPSNVGALKYYCKAKNKKTMNDGDLAAAFVRGQMKKLPILVITTGKLTKKAQEMLNTEFNGMSVKNI